MSWPDCHSRREIAGQSVYSFCAHPRVHSRGNVVTEPICLGCERRLQAPPATLRSMPPDPLVRITSPCRFLGEQIGLRDCPTCRGKIQLKVFACGHPNHHETTPLECQACRDFAAARPTIGQSRYVMEKHSSTS